MIPEQRLNPWPIVAAIVGATIWWLFYWLVPKVLRWFL
jgi:hypothetical protein